MWLWRSLFGGWGASSDTPEALERRIRSLETELEAEDTVDDKTAKGSVKKNGPEKLFHETRVAKVTHLDDESGRGLIDGKLPFDARSAEHLRLKVGDTVVYSTFSLSGTRDPNATVLQKLETYWDEGDAAADRPVAPPPERAVEQKVIIGKAVEKDGRTVTFGARRIRFDLDRVRSDFVPELGDWIEATVVCSVAEEEFGADDEILEVSEVRSLRKKKGEGVVTVWDRAAACGLIDSHVFFARKVLRGGLEPRVGDEVAYDAIESDQGRFTFRAVSVVLGVSARKNRPREMKEVRDDESSSIRGVSIPESVFNVADVTMPHRKRIEVEIKNRGSKSQTLLRCVFLSKFSVSQVRLATKDVANVQIRPNESFWVAFDVLPKFFGHADEDVSFDFEGFKIRRTFKMNVVDPDWNERYSRPKKYIKEDDGLSAWKLQKLKNVERLETIPGVRPVKPAPYVAVRLPPCEIPQTVIDLFFETEALCRPEQELALDSQLAILGLPLNKDTYANKFHTLLYFEEMQIFLRLKSLDSDRAFMTKSGEFLVLEIDGLRERRPTLQFGDTAIVKNPWYDSGPNYQGIIHKITDESVYFKFSDDFHEKYTGEDVAIEFLPSRANLKKSHFAIDIARSHLGPEILFPNRITLKKNQLDVEDGDECENRKVASNNNSPNKTKKRHRIRWYNPELNSIQKKAVVNILEGKARPLPYIIFGPPGTGKTVTLVEAILQLIKLLPDSRLLIGTPSNSAANLLLERLVDNGRFKPGFIIRLSSINHIKSGLVPDRLKPYFATLDVGMEHSYKSNHYMDGDGIQYGCDKSVVGRHRITVGTCMTLGTLVRMGFPVGHFTHVLVDEAAQTTEPESMMVATFIGKASGQIVLSGDPMQLGPIVLSKTSGKYGLEESYMERLLKCGPYQRDVDGRGPENDGFDGRLVTKLRYNYRAIQPVMQITNKFFYDDALICHMDESVPWIKSCVQKLHSAFNCEAMPKVMFHGIRGSNFQTDSSPSWFNPQEAAMVMLLVNKLYNNDFAPDDIGIITPYAQQVQHIRALIANLGLEPPKVGSVEEFQGQERKIVILSTVRSVEEKVTMDILNRVGFVRNKKRVNVALSRAQTFLIIYGNPHLLALDPLWRDIIQHILKNDGYIGCNIPKELTE